MHRPHPSCTPGSSRPAIRLDSHHHIPLVLRAAAQAARGRHLARARATADERLGLGQLALRLEQRCQVADGEERVRVLRAELTLVALTLTRRAPTKPPIVWSLPSFKPPQLAPVEDINSIRCA